MPLTRLHAMFECISHDTPEVLVDDPGWLFAQRCESRWCGGGFDTDPVTAVLVYRSTMVKDTSEMYAPVAEILLGAARVELLGRGTIEDSQMMKGRGEWMVLRTTHMPSFPEGPYSLELIRETIQAATEAALTGAGVLA
ncbi:hypothetical protein PBI_BOGOSYJAY_76 [Mycobacterium phage BogosyJay]|nr:hypothetical protein PBI_MAMINIAINA_76 [Mycobacterium phage Maminiaina]QFG14983.1 hypothetical protein PBI_BOGOSYJAY_76 [Mycobacterium phage BogosyJay]